MARVCVCLECIHSEWCCTHLSPELSEHVTGFTLSHHRITISEIVFFDANRVWTVCAHHTVLDWFDCQSLVFFDIRSSSVIYQYSVAISTFHYYYKFDCFNATFGGRFKESRWHQLVLGSIVDSVCAFTTRVCVCAGVNCQLGVFQLVTSLSLNSICNHVECAARMRSIWNRMPY